MTNRYTSKEIEAQFWIKTLKKGPNDCWEWLGALDTSGYGILRINDKLWKTHRYSYQLHKGPIGNLCVLHTCDNPSCVNPKHLFLGTASDNAKDRDKKNRGCLPYQIGKNNKPILLNKQIEEIRMKYIPYSYSMYKLAKEYGVSYYTIYNVLNYQGGYSHLVS